MIDLIRTYQLELMLILCGACAGFIFLLFFTRFLSKSRKLILILMEAMAFFLLWFDRMAYIYAGDVSRTGYVMVRLSNFIVFFLTSGLVLGLNLYISDWLTHEGKLESAPIPMRVTAIVAVAGMCLAVIAAFTDLYYYFDETNQYHRGSGFLIAYIIPVVCPLIQFVVICRYRKVFSKLIFTSIVLYIFIPIICGITQIFTYGISIVNMSMVAVSVSIYVFMYLDLNNTVERAHKIEIKSIQGEQKRVLEAFERTAVVFVSTVEKKEELEKGYYLKIADYAKRIATNAGESPAECEKVYYATMLHDTVEEESLADIVDLTAKDISNISKIYTIANDYVSMTTKKKDRDELPRFVVRENFVKDSGVKYDPDLADIMVKIIDSESNEIVPEDAQKTETEISCRDYRERVSGGISIEGDVKRISFEWEAFAQRGEGFSAPSIVLFDSFDARAHNDEKAIEAYHYFEYGEVWFDKYSVTTEARAIEEKRTEDTLEEKDRYEIIASRYEDHIKLVMRSEDYAKEIIMALPSRSKAVYIGLTGENCRLFNISVEKTGDTVGPEDIPRIAQPVSYIDHLESDLKNIQIDRWMSSSTDGVEIKGKLKVSFHTMSLPEATLIWHCPYIVLFYSENGRIGGPDYREYNLIKLNGEDQGDKEYAKNRFVMKKTGDFPGWDKWKEINKEGLECELNIERKGDRITLKTENLGISIENTTTVTDDKSKVYISLSGDQVALTDIRID